MSGKPTSSENASPSRLPDTSQAAHHELSRSEELTSLQKLRFRLLPAGSRQEALARRLYRTFRRRISSPFPADFETRYQAWIAAYEPSRRELDGQRAQAQALAYRPLISIVTPVYNPPPKVLAQTIRSVQTQTYPFWELCLADGASTLPGVHETLQRAAKTDARIRVVYNQENLGISGNSNVALWLAEGEFVLFLDHDDLLAPQALFEIVKRLEADPLADLIYYDEDKVDLGGKRRRDPLFKPDWSPEMLLSANTLTHPTIRRSLLQSSGGFNPEFDGTQDWDLVLRLTERTRRIVHIPRVLYHWRQVAGSTAGEFNAKSYVFERQRRAVREHLERTGIKQPEAAFERLGVLRVTWPAPRDLVSIIIPTRDNPTMLRKCLSSLLEKTCYPEFEVILVDNRSVDRETLAYYRELEGVPCIRVIPYPEPFNYSRANNLGAGQAHGAYLLFLNNDVEALDPGWLEELARWAARPGVGAVGGKLLYPDGTLQHAVVVVGLCGHADHVFAHALEGYGGIFGSSDWYRNYSALTGACLMVARRVFEQVGGFNEDYRLVYNDIEFCLRLVEAGYRNVYTPFARLVHHEGGTRGRAMPVEDMRRAYERFKKRVDQGDPYFNPNISYGRQIPDLKLPGEEGRLERLTRLTLGE